MKINNENTVSGNKDILISDVFLEIWASKWLVIFVTMIITSFSVVYSYYSEPEFKAEVVIVASNQGEKSSLSMLAGNLSGLAGLAGISVGGSGSGVDEALAILHSKIFIKDFIESHKLLPILMDEYWDKSEGVWVRPKEPFLLSIFNKEKTTQDQWSPSLDAGVSRFIQNMVIEKDEKTSIMKISIISHRRDQVSVWANQLVISINERIRNREVLDLNKSINYLKEQLTKTNLHQMEQVIYSLLESQVQKIMLANVRDDYVFSVIDPATEPKKPFKPRKQLIISLGLIIGLMLSSSFIITRKMISR